MFFSAFYLFTCGYYQEQLKSGSQASKRKKGEEDEEGEQSEKKKRKGGKKRRKDKTDKSYYEIDEAEANRVEYQDDVDEPVSDYGEHTNQLNTGYDDGEENAQDLLAAAGLEDSDAEDDVGAPSAASRRKQAWAESDEDEPVYRQGDSSPFDQETGTARDDENEPIIEGDDDED